MKVIAGPRGSGKTTKLVELAIATNGCIIVHNSGAISTLMDLGMPRDRIIRITEIQANRYPINGPMYVDNVELAFVGLLSMLNPFLANNLRAASVSLSKEDIETMINQRIVEGIMLNPEETTES